MNSILRLLSQTQFKPIIELSYIIKALSRDIKVGAKAYKHLATIELALI
jgi:hypothetical protein